MVDVAGDRQSRRVCKLALCLSKNGVTGRFRINTPIERAGVVLQEAHFERGDFGAWANRGTRDRGNGFRCGCIRKGSSQTQPLRNGLDFGADRIRVSGMSSHIPGIFDVIGIANGIAHVGTGKVVRMLCMIGFACRCIPLAFIECDHKRTSLCANCSLQSPLMFVFSKAYLMLPCCIRISVSSAPKVWKSCPIPCSVRSIRSSIFCASSRVLILELAL